MDFEESRRIYIGIAISSGISIMCCSFVIFLYLSKPELRSFSFKMICFLLSNDILDCIGMLIPTYGSSTNATECKTQAILGTITMMLCSFWPFIIGLHLFLSMSGRKTEGFMKWYLISVWTLSLGLGLLPLIEGQYGNNFGWCWVKQKSFIYEFILSYIPVWIAIIGNFYFYINIIVKTNKTIQNIQDNEELKESINKLKLYPLVSLFCYTPVTLNRIFEFFYDPNFYFVIIAVIISCCHGLLNSIVYGSNRITKNSSMEDSILSQYRNSVSQRYYNEIV
jgi:Slime mold cyclic AMP receptor